MGILQTQLQTTQAILARRVTLPEYPGKAVYPGRRGKRGAPGKRGTRDNNRQGWEILSPAEPGVTQELLAILEQVAAVVPGVLEEGGDFKAPVVPAAPEEEMDRWVRLEMLPVLPSRQQDLAGLVAAVPGQQTTELRGSIKYK
jgi:hypothetical protein